MRVANSKPLSPGIVMSSIAASGWCFSINRKASCPSPASATTVCPDISIKDRRPARTSE